MPQVWLNDEELGGFLNEEPVLACHLAIRNDWPRMAGDDEVMRYKLPPGRALEYVLANVRSRPLPRDAVLFEKALERVEDLERKLTDAQVMITMLQRRLDAVTTNPTDEMVSALRAASAAIVRRPNSRVAQNALQ